MYNRGRGRGRGSFGARAKEEKYDVFPEMKELPAINLEQAEQYTTFIRWGDNLEKFWKSSPYHLEDPKDLKNDEKTVRKPPLSDYIKMSSDYVPGELVGKNVRPSKKTRWDLQADLNKLDLFEKLDKRPQVQDEEKKEDEEEDEDLENIEDDEVDSDDDYGQNGGFDDDEDDFNMHDDHDDDEGCY